MRTPAQLECKAEPDDDKAALMLPASDNIRQQAKLLGASPPSLVTSAESPVRFSPAVSIATTNNINHAQPHSHGSVTAGLVSDVKPVHDAIDDDRSPNRDAIGTAADNEKLPVRSADVPVFESSSQRVRWLSGVSCTSSSTSGGEESPKPTGSAKNETNSSLSKWFSGSRPSLYHGQTSTPVNGWLESTSTQSQQHVLTEAGDVGQFDKSSESVDGHGSIISTSSVTVDSISFHKLPDTSNADTSLGSGSSIERLCHPDIGLIQENRQWLSSSISPENRWNSRLSIPEPFWASRATSFQPHVAAIQPGGGFDGSRTPPSFSGGLSDVPNSMPAAQNVSPSTPLAAPPSKKRVSLCCFSVCVVVVNGFCSICSLIIAHWSRMCFVVKFFSSALSPLKSLGAFGHLAKILLACQQNL